MKPIVLYNTNYNTTKLAAEVIANYFKIEEVLDINKFDQQQIENYDTVFLGSNIRAFQIGKNVSKLLKKIKKESLNLKVFLFLVAGTPDPLGIEKAKKLQGKYNSIVDFGAFGGRMTYSELNDADKEMIRIGYEMMNREIEDYDDFKEEDVINFCQRVENSLNS
ncbi:MAG: flavodoxin domain-containing protein [Promethearchaeota archaeon]